MGVLVIVLAAGYGVGVGLLLPRAVWRMGVEPGEPWRERCPEGHVVAGWLGAARCRVPAAAVAAGPDAPRPGPDALPPGPDALPPGPDALPPGSDALPPGPDAPRPGSDAPRKQRETNTLPW
ncbi:prepilin peptidase, partial [Streptomyces sp. NPDC048270]